MAKLSTIEALLIPVLFVAIAAATNYKLQFQASDTEVTINPTRQTLTVQRNGKVVQDVLMDRDIQSANEYEETLGRFVLRNRRGEEIEFIKDVDQPGLSLLTVARRSRHRSRKVSDCVKLRGSNWFGGPEQKNQYWPIQKLHLQDYSYLSKQVDNCAVAERYWLNSRGSFVFVDDETPLFLDQNSRIPGYMCLEAKKSLPYDTYDETYSFVYQIGVGVDAREAHLGAVQNVLGKPTGHPAEEMVKYPIWSTWARYKRDINEAVVLNHADDIVKNGWANSQFEIDDFWETCYGSLTINTTKFPNMKQTVADIKAKGLPRVTLWVMPSIQFSYVPFDFDEETIRISKEMTNLHEKYSPLIMERFRAAVSGGYPVNPPIWWVSPEDTVAQAIDDQFLLGDDVIAAPVIVENARTRDIYLPEGEWVDGNLGTVYEGPIWLRDYEATLNVLPYFVRKSTYQRL